MRLWHKDLIPYLPRQQLLGQWRECCLIARQIAVNGTPNHILVNQVMNYPAAHFNKYVNAVYIEMVYRGYRVNPERIQKWLVDDPGNPSVEELYYGWHDHIYLRECLYNLEEKYRAGGISRDEWAPIHNAFSHFTPLVY